MMTDQEINVKIEEVCTNFVGQLDDLQAAVGLVVVGRLYGWRVMRLVSPRRHWTIATQYFGDLKILLPERGVLAHKSQGLIIADKIGRYWDMIGGKGNRDALPLHDRKMIL